MAQPKNCPNVINTTTELKNMITCENMGTLLSCNTPRQIPLLYEVVLLSWSSTVVITQNRQFLDCANIALREWYVHFSFLLRMGRFPSSASFLASLDPQSHDSTIPPFHYCNPLMASRLYTQDDFQRLSMPLEAHLIMYCILPISRMNS
jgi:hypothetical protein